MCESLVKEIYGNQDLTKPTEKFSRCGAWVSRDPIVKQKVPGDWTQGYVMEEKDPVLVHPEVTYENASIFFANFDPMQIPYFDDFSIQVVPDTYTDANGVVRDNVCFKNALAVSAGWLSLALLTLHAFAL